MRRDSGVTNSLAEFGGRCRKRYSVCMCVCVRACVRACARACVRGCGCGGVVP